MASTMLRTMGAVALLSVMPAIALAAQPTGNWRGLIRDARTDVRALISFTPNGASVHFDEPVACSVPAKFLKEEGDTVIYRFTVSRNGGRFCDSVFGRDLTMKRAADGRMQTTFDTPKASWRGDFQRVNAP